CLTLTPASTRGGRRSASRRANPLQPEPRPSSRAGPPTLPTRRKSMTRGPKPGGRRKGEEKRGLCTWCGESKRRLEFGAGRWRHKDSCPLVCLACKPIAMRAKELEMEYAFARDIVGMDHRRALQWLADHCDRSLDYLEQVFGYEVAKP